MKKRSIHIIITVLLFSFFSASAQDKYKRADDLFAKMWYVKAAEAYEKVIEEGDTTKQALQKAGDAYYFNTNMENAYRWYDRLVSQYPNNVDSEYIFRYAHTLLGLGKHKEAKKWMTAFSKKAKKEDLRTIKFDQEQHSIDDILALEPQFTLRNLSINTVNSDFGPMYYKENTLVYSSAADTSYYHERRYRWNEQPFLNLYIGRMNTLQNDVIKIEGFSKEINTKYHEASAAFSPDGKKMYFTRNNYNGELGRDLDGINHLKLYSAKSIVNEKGNQVWEDIKELPFNSINYSVGHPALSPDGKKLYFVSDMPGTIGATDIFVVDVLDNDEYSMPKNLGTRINTAGREMFPFVTNEKLYFASDGYLGLGGLDVFETKYLKEGSFESPINLGAPLNSELDDFGFIINEKSKTGFVCSNRKNGKGDDDIYSFERFELPCSQKIEGNIIEQKRKIPVEDVTVILTDRKGGFLEKTKTNITGEFTFEQEYPCKNEYEIQIKKEGYKDNMKSVVTTDKNEETQKVTIPMEKELNKLIISENGILKIDVGVIYFDLGKHYIRSDAALELNKVVSLMNEYPEMVIKIESHTDSRGSDAYNLKLSQRRATSTKDYIISQGIAQERIQSAIGYGETQLINNCENGVKCEDKDHDVNRRSEFIIIKM